jgi:plastocyanin
MPAGRKSSAILVFAAACLSLAPSFAEEGKAVKIVANEFSFRPAKLKVAKGEVEFVVTNRGKFPHSFALVGRPERLGYIESGETQSLKVRFESEGEVVFYCAQPGHRGRGMEGRIEVGK